MKILVIGDLHGRKPQISKKLYFDAIVSVGDVCSDKEIGSWMKKWFKFIKEHPGEEIDCDSFIIKNVGKRKFYEMEKKSLKEGRKILEYLGSFGKPIFMVAGNWDQSYRKTKIKDINKDTYNYMKYFYDSWLGDKINPKLVKGLENIKDCMFHVHKFNEFNFIGYGLSSAPEKIKGGKKLKKEKKEILQKLNSAYKKIVDKLFNVYKKRKNKNLPTIFITHNIPYKTKLDVIKNKHNYAHGKHLGSNVAREFCLKYKPMICIGGHIHDHKGKDKIGKTIVINPGYGSRAQVLIDLDEGRGKVKSVRFLK